MKVASGWTPSETWRLMVIVTLLGIGMSCSGAGATSPPAPTMPPSAVPPVVDPAPSELQGVWVTALKDGTNERVTLRLTEKSYQITRGLNRASGTIAVRGSQIEFSESSLCDGTGAYRWSISAGSLQFVAISPDPCSGRTEVLDGQTYTKNDAAS